MSARQSRSASTPNPAARNIEQAIPMSFTMPSAQVGASRQRLVSNTRPLPHTLSDRGMANISSRTNIANSPVGTITSGSYSSIVARPIVGNNNASYPPFEPRIIRASTSPSPPSNKSDPTCYPGSQAPRVRRQSSTGRQPSTYVSQPTPSIRPVPPPTALAPPSGNSSSHSSHQVFSRPTYLDHSAFRHLIQTNVPAPVQSAELPPTQAPSAPTHSHAFYPFMGRTSSPSMDSDEDSNVSRTPARSLHASSSKDAWTGKATFPLPTRWSEMDRHTSLAISPDGRDLRFCGQSISLGCL